LLLGRSSTGFDRLFDLINNAHLSEASGTYPPYDIVRTGSDSFRISLAVAGFAPENLRIVAQQNLLTVAGEKSGGNDQEYSSKVFPATPSSASSAWPTTLR
jgi:molecular chaperone IbpA